MACERGTGPKAGLFLRREAGGECAINRVDWLSPGTASYCLTRGSPGFVQIIP
jgi:hypothetical protein